MSTVTTNPTPLSKLPFFDARKVPVIATDGHLPAVPLEALAPDALRRRFAQPPAWQPEVVKELRFTDRQPAHAAVLVGIVAHPGRPTLLLTQRTAHLSTHSGQIAFAGGKADDEDLDAAATALREAQEEVGLDPAQAEVLGTLPVYTTGTAFIITPVVALLAPPLDLRPNPFEVESAFEVPLDFLMNPAHHQRHAFEWEGQRREWFSMPYRDGEGETAHERFIWGATAGMLRNLYRFLVA